MTNLWGVGRNRVRPAHSPSFGLPELAPALSRADSSTRSNALPPVTVTESGDEPPHPEPEPAITALVNTLNSLDVDKLQQTAKACASIGGRSIHGFKKDCHRAVPRGQLYSGIEEVHP